MLNKVLASLPKTHSVASLRFKRAPGVSAALLQPRSSPLPLKQCLDPTHPSTSLPPNLMPSYTSPLFTLRSYPFAMLRPFHSENRQRVAALPPRPPVDQLKGVPMALVNIVGKKGVHKGACVRIRVKRRMKEALRLVVLRGASRSEGGEIVLNESDIGENMWLLKDWVYVFTPSLQMYKHPFPEIIHDVRSALQHIKESGDSLIKRWQNFPPREPDRPSRNPQLSRTYSTSANAGPPRQGQETLARRLLRRRLDQMQYQETPKEHPPHPLDGGREVIPSSAAMLPIPPTAARRLPLDDRINPPPKPPPSRYLPSAPRISHFLSRRLQDKSKSKLGSEKISLLAEQQYVDAVEPPTVIRFIVDKRRAGMRAGVSAREHLGEVIAPALPRIGSDARKVSRDWIGEDSYAEEQASTHVFGQHLKGWDRDVRKGYAAGGELEREKTKTRRDSI